MPDNCIIFIGPMGVGKTSIAKKVSAVLNFEYIDIDALRWKYFIKQQDYDEEYVEKLFNEGKEIEAFNYFKPFEARLVVDFLKDKKNGVYDFGAGYSVYNDEALFNKVKTAFSDFEYVIFLRYSNDANESLEALHKRHIDIPDKLYFTLNKEFIESPCNELLATHIIDTKNKSVEQSTESVLSIVSR
jgi:shikimate kinase